MVNNNYRIIVIEKKESMDAHTCRFPTQAAWRKGPIVAQLVTHVPDCVVHLDHSKKLPHFDRFDGVVFFADVSGFTSLCEKYTMSGSKSGIDQLTKALNGYIGALVDRILSADGDVLEYAGDAILAIWTVKDVDHLPGAIYRAIKCALSIQSNFNAWETDVGVTLRVKIGIAAGEICIQYQGHDEFRHYTATGKAVEDVNTAETFCQSGYIVVSPHAWGLCTKKIKKDVIHETVQDGRHVRVWEGFGAHSSRYNIRRTIKPIDALKEVKNKNLGEKLKNLLLDAEQYSSTGLTNIAPRCEYGNKLRESLLVDDDDVLKSILRLYIIKPVLKKLDDDQPLEYLSEVRKVTVMFTNLSLNDRMTHKEMSLVLQESFEIVYDVCAPLNGCLHKIFAFDKDAKALTFLTIFGLPGFKHENNSRHALQAASHVHVACSQMNYVEAVSIGVTTGATFCGVIGHKHRQEYTVIGRKVNTAARFMMNYPRRVVCDKETFYNSELSKSHFNEMDAEALKGLQNVGTVREYIGSGDVAVGSQMKYRKFFSPLLSRKKEVQTIRRQILLKRDGGDKVPPSTSHIIIIEGEAGVGKTRLLCEILSYAEMEQKIGVFYCRCTINSKRIPYFTIRSLLAEMLKLNMFAHYQDREQVLLQMFSPKEIKEALFLLNDIFHVKFPVVQEAVYNGRENGILDLIERILYEASSKYGFMLFSVDDAFYMDKESSMFLVPLCMSGVSMVLMTKRPSKEGEEPFLAECLRIMPKNARKVSVVSIGGMEPSSLSSLACQMLRVKAIPRLLAEVLAIKSNGVPQWCEELLRKMLSNKLIEIVPATEQNLNNKSMVRPNSEELLLNANVDDSAYSLALNTPKVCVIDPLNNERIKEIPIPESVKASSLSRIDQMTPTDQLTIKRASILGESFQLDLLVAIIPSNEKMKTKSSVIRLIKNGVFACGAKVDKELNDDRSSGLPVSNQCFCTLYIKAKEDFSLCKTLVFTSATMQETAYEILLEDQRVLLHQLAAVFLETNAFKCKYCGGGDIMPYRLRALSTTVDIEPTEEEKETLFPSDFGVPRTEHTCTQMMKSRVRRMSNEHGKGSLHVQSMSGQKLFNSNRVTRIFESEEEGAPTPTSGLKTPDDQLSRRKSCIPEFLGLPQTLGADKITDSSEEESDLLSDEEQRECECSSVLRCVYPELARHWKCTGNARNTIYALCHAAAAEIEVNEITRALAYLEEVENIIDMLKEGENPFKKYVSRVQSQNISKNAYAVFYMFKGQAQAQLGKSIEAEQCFRRALKLWKKSQPSNALTYSIKIAIEKFKLRLHRKNPSYSKNQPVKSSMKDPSVQTDVVKCLHSLYQIHMCNQNFKAAFAAALQQLNIVEKSTDSLSSLVSAYTCIIEVTTALDMKQVAEMYQNIALHRIYGFIDELTPDDFLSISCLHSIMMQAFLNKGKLEAACDAGQNVIWITKRIDAPEVALHVLPSLAEALLLRMENIECVQVLKYIQVIAEKLRDKIGITWYYMGSLNLVLYTGHILEDPEVCNKFFLETWSHPSLAPEKILKFHIAIAMCLWYTRTGSILKAESWYSRAEEVMPPMATFHTFMGSLAYSKVVECQLLRLSQFSTSSSRPDMIEWKVQLKDVMKTFNKICQHIEVIKPRKFLLEAFAHGISGDDKAMRSSLAACIAKSEQLRATFDEDWAEHNKKIWESETIFQVPFWQRQRAWHPDLDEELEGEDEEMKAGVNVHYTLPLPYWFSQTVCLWEG